MLQNQFQLTAQGFFRWRRRSSLEFRAWKRDEASQNQKRCAAWAVVHFRKEALRRRAIQALRRWSELSRAWSRQGWGIAKMLRWRVARQLSKAMRQWEVVSKAGVLSNRARWLTSTTEELHYTVGALRLQNDELRDATRKLTLKYQDTQSRQDVGHARERFKHRQQWVTATFHQFFSRWRYSALFSRLRQHRISRVALHFAERKQRELFRRWEARAFKVAGKVDLSAPALDAYQIYTSTPQGWTDRGVNLSNAAQNDVQ